MENSSSEGDTSLRFKLKRYYRKGSDEGPEWEYNGVVNPDSDEFTHLAHRGDGFNLVFVEDEYIEEVLNLLKLVREG